MGAYTTVLSSSRDRGYRPPGRLPLL